MLDPPSGGRSPRGSLDQALLPIVNTLQEINSSTYKADIYTTTQLCLMSDS